MCLKTPEKPHDIDKSGIVIVSKKTIIRALQRNGPWRYRPRKTSLLQKRHISRTEVCQREFGSMFWGRNETKPELFGLGEVAYIGRKKGQAKIYITTFYLHHRIQYRGLWWTPKRADLFTAKINKCLNELIEMYNDNKGIKTWNSLLSHLSPSWGEV